MWGVDSVSFRKGLLSEGRGSSFRIDNLNTFAELFHDGD